MAEIFHTFYRDIPMALKDKLASIKVVVFDVDGTLTDGSIVLDNNDHEYKSFNCQDGMGISLLLKAGVEVAIITGRVSELTARRGRELHIKHVLQGHMHKEDALLGLLSELNLSTSELAVLGDDFTDLDLFKHAEIKCCPQDGYQYMKTIATMVMGHNGGRGAAREFCDLILMAKGLMDPITGEPYQLTRSNDKLSKIQQ